MGVGCSRATADVIPDRDVMVEIVDSIVSFEEMLKKGERLTKAQVTKKRGFDRVAKQMRRMVRVSEDTRV